MKQIVRHTIGSLLGGPLGGLAALGIGAAKDAEKQQKRAAAAQQQLVNGQRRQMSDADNERKRILQDGARVMGRRRGPLTSYSGNA